MRTPITCTACGTDVDPLEVFPNDVCLPCYRTTPEANAPLSAVEVANLFRRGF